MQSFVILDSNALIHRAYHAIPKTLSAPDGRMINAVYGFTNLLLGILEVERPAYLGAAFDMKGATFRHEFMATYKGTRAETDDTLIAQFPLVREVVQAFSIPIFEKEGYEADDFLGIVAEQVKNMHPEVKVVIVTNDQDALQLVGDRVEVVAPQKGYKEVIRYSPEKVHQKLGVWPEQIPDYKGLRGDSSDNIPGVPGIGPKTAASLLEKFKSLDELYEHLESVSPVTVREKLRAHRDGAFLSRQIATILKEDKDFDFQLSRCKMHDFDVDKVRVVFEKFAFNSPLRKMESLDREWQKRRLEEAQPSLF